MDFSQVAALSDAMHVTVLMDWRRNSEIDDNFWQLTALCDSVVNVDAEI